MPISDQAACPRKGGTRRRKGIPDNEPTDSAVREGVGRRYEHPAVGAEDLSGIVGSEPLSFRRNCCSGSVIRFVLDERASHLSLSASTWFQPSGMHFLSFDAGERRGRAVASIGMILRSPSWDLPLTGVSGVPSSLTGWRNRLLGAVDGTFLSPLSLCLTLKSVA